MEQLQIKPLNGIRPELQNIDLSTPERRQEQLEILLCQKAQKGEDVSPLIEALYYLTSAQTKEDQFKKVWNEVVKEKSVFNSFQRVIITAFAVLGMIAFFNGVFKSNEPSQAVVNPPAVGQR
ncbi:hypothetical protein [Halotia branconii]|uniref:Uncharacterized protein n=1 Tax=Halotia branconii CENA392 TaxID=1539056 RepID=A0AAJ6PCN6_9CYAN|nr:hypothetical protein [Halotia branconii]WGV29052.1 hypothetical protein QI031_31325 [Halotia branconii CENA392]